MLWSRTRSRIGASLQIPKMLQMSFLDAKSRDRQLPVATFEMVGVERFEISQPLPKASDNQQSKKGDQMSDTQMDTCAAEAALFLRRFDELESRHRETVLALLIERAGPEAWAVANLYVATAAGSAK